MNTYGRTAIPERSALTPVCDAEKQPSAIGSELKRLEESVFELAGGFDRLRNRLEAIMRVEPPQPSPNGKESPDINVPLAEAIGRQRRLVQALSGDLNTILSRIEL